MRIEPVKNEKVDRFKDLTPTHKMTRKVAIALAFVGVFVWLFKIMF
ncbi:MAG: hypothetical protein ABIN91_07985 [Mucilaginibacter sp.]